MTAVTPPVIDDGTFLAISGAIAAAFGGLAYWLRSSAPVPTEQDFVRLDDMRQQLSEMKAQQRYGQKHELRAIRNEVAELELLVGRATVPSWHRIVDVLIFPFYLIGTAAFIATFVMWLFGYLSPPAWASRPFSYLFLPVWVGLGWMQIRAATRNPTRIKVDQLLLGIALIGLCTLVILTR